MVAYLSGIGVYVYSANGIPGDAVGFKKQVNADIQLLKPYSQALQQMALAGSGSVLVDYSDMDLPFQTQAFYFLFPMHSQLGCSDTLIHGAGYYARASFYAIRFDTLYDAISNQEVNLSYGSNACVKLELDSLYLFFSHFKPLTTSPGVYNDTIVALVHPVVGGIVDYNTILYAETLITDTTLSGDTSLQQDVVIGIYVWAIDIPAGSVVLGKDTFAAVSLHLYGLYDTDNNKDSTSVILPVVVMDDPCGGSCLGYSPIPYEGMTEFGLLYPVSSICQTFTANCQLFSDCNFNSTVDPSACECLTFNLAWIARYIYWVDTFDADVNVDPNVYMVNIGDTLNIVAEAGFSSYMWGGSGIVDTVGNQATVVASGLPCVGVQKVWVSVSNGTCVMADTVYIYAIDNLQVDADINNPTNVHHVCSGSIVSLSATPGFSSYQWSGTIPILSAVGNQAVVYAVTNQQLDTAYVYLKADSGVCSATDTVVFIIHNPPPLDADTANPNNVYHICAGDTITLVATPGYTSYQWFGNIVVSSGGNQAMVYPVTSQPVDTQFVWVVATDGFCTDTDTVVFYIYNYPPLDADIYDADNLYSVCSGDTVILVATPGYQWYLWSGNVVVSSSGNSAIVYAVTSQPRDTQVVYVTAIGDVCMYVDSVVFYIYNPPLLDADINDPDNSHVICRGDTVLLVASSGYDMYIWQGPHIVDTMGSSAWVSYQGGYPTSFYVVVTADAGGVCVSMDSVYFQALDYPQAMFSVVNVDASTGTVTFTNQSQNYSGCFWDFGDGDTSMQCGVGSHVYTQPGVYTITLVVYNACGSDTHSVTVDVRRVTSVATPGGNVSVMIYGGERSIVIRSALAIKRLVVTDLQGRVIWKEDLAYPVTKDIRVIPGAAGIYIVTVELESEGVFRGVVVVGE